MEWREFEKRESVLTRKARRNDTVSIRFLLYYKQIVEELGGKENVDDELVADTYLYMTYKYAEKDDFVKSFVAKYRSLQGERIRCNYIKRNLIKNNADHQAKNDNEGWYTPDEE